MDPKIFKEDNNIIHTELWAPSQKDKQGKRFTLPSLDFEIQ